MPENSTSHQVVSPGLLNSIFSLPHFWLKLICVLATFVAMQLVGLLALVIMRRLRVRRVERFRTLQSYTLCGGAGVLLGSCFLALFPAIRSSVDAFLVHTELGRDSYELHTAPRLASVAHMPFAEVFEVFGFIFVWLLESLFQMAMQNSFERRARQRGIGDDNDFVSAAGSQARAGRNGGGHSRDKTEYMPLGAKGRGKARSRGPHDPSRDQRVGLLTRGSSSSESTDEDSGNYSTRPAHKNQQQPAAAAAAAGSQQNQSQQSRSQGAPKPQALPPNSSNNDLPAGCHDVGDFAEIAAATGAEDGLVGGSTPSANLLVHSALVDVQLKVRSRYRSPQDNLVGIYSRVLSI